MNIRSVEIASKKHIGSLKGRPVFEIATKGGYHLVCSPKGAGIEYLGAGPHRAVARFIAKKRERDLKISDLAKADHVEPEFFQHLLPQCEALTDQLNSVRG
jgi:hypothetical protein